MKRRTIVLTIVLTVAGAFLFWLIGAQRSSISSGDIRKAAQAASSGNSEQATQGQQVLRQLGPRAVPTLSRQVVRGETLMEALRRNLSPLFPQVIRSKIHKAFPPTNPLTDKLNALRALSLIGTNATAALPALERVLQEPQLAIAWNAANALARIGPEGLPPLIRSLQSTNPITRQAGCYGLGVIASNAAPAVSNLVLLLGDSVEPVRLAARDSLFRIGEPAAAQLATAAVLGSELVSTGALQVLVLTKTSLATSTLIQYCSNTNFEIRLRAATAIGNLAPLDTNALATLTKLLDDPEALVSLAATRGLLRARHNPQQVTSKLTELLHSPSADIRASAANAFQHAGTFGLPVLLELERLLADPAEIVRQSASNSIATLRDTPAAPPR